MTVCPRCGQENPEGAKFCNECAAPLGEAPVGREQRKTVTVLFCDVTGSTQLGETLDPETLRALLARYFERMKAIVEHHGGTVEKFIGDAVMAVFGLPVLHEDDALRALRAAVEMDCLRPLLEGLVAEVDRWDAIYAEWTERFPASAAIWDEWRARLATTKTLLSDMLEVAQEEGLN